MDKKHYTQALILLSLGYLVDFFDLTLFAVVRAQILESFHIPPSQAMSVSRLMFNVQAIGIVLGGLVSGIWGDKIGRMSSVRFGILLYSSAILWSAFTTSLETFIILRFLAGVGLAGELAASVTFMTEISDKKQRDIATSTIYFTGVLGGMLATVLGSWVEWKTLFIIGGVAGFALLGFRLSIKDPLMFYALKDKIDIRRGSLRTLFFKMDSLIRVIGLAILLIPFWFMVYFINFGPEIGRQIGLKSPASQSVILGCFFVGSVFGSYGFALLANLFKSRKKSLIFAFTLMIVSIVLFSFGPYLQLWQFYGLMAILGLVCGYPGIYMALVAESFGTNQRATGTCFISCLGRGSLVILNFFIPWMMGIFSLPWIGMLASSMCVFILSISAMVFLKDTHHRSIDFVE